MQEKKPSISCLQEAGGNKNTSLHKTSIQKREIRLKVQLCGLKNVRCPKESLMKISGEIRSEKETWEERRGEFREGTSWRIFSLYKLTFLTQWTWGRLPRWIWHAGIWLPVRHHCKFSHRKVCSEKRLVQSGLYQHIDFLRNFKRNQTSSSSTPRECSQPKELSNPANLYCPQVC